MGVQLQPLCGLISRQTGAIPAYLLALFLIAITACGRSHGLASDDGDDSVIAVEDSGTPRMDFDASVIALPDASTACVLREPERHRLAGTTCDHERPWTELPSDIEEWQECQSHEDCADAGLNGRCVETGRVGWICTADECFDDLDCRGGELCDCSGANSSDANVCTPGNCRTDMDCGAGGWCSPTFGSCGDYAGFVAYYCRTCEDECLDDSDCLGPGSGYCAYSEVVGRWVCSYSHCDG